MKYEQYVLKIKITEEVGIWPHTKVCNVVLLKQKERFDLSELLTSKATVYETPPLVVYRLLLCQAIRASMESPLSPAPLLQELWCNMFMYPILVECQQQF